MFNQIQLSYEFNALEPHIDALTMETHYLKHHAAYTKNLNDAVEKAGITEQDIKLVLSSLNRIEDEGLRKSIRNNGGGFYNHNLYFSVLAPNGEHLPVGKTAQAIERDFGGYPALQEQLTKLALGQFGSGWAWLSSNQQGKLQISASANQDNPLMDGQGLTPILGIDVWEHAYYLKYKNLRADYVKAFFDVIDWQEVENNYLSVINGQ
ncbi:MAG: superoxide dismutase [Erysipelotrichaceae bacterium]|nr:superoxide dismutase [Erysipelotrichaceae bacterium]